MNWWIALGIFVGLVLFWCGEILGYRKAKRDYAKLIDAGVTYFDALDEAMGNCTLGTKMTISLLVEIPERPSSKESVKLTVIEGSKR